MSLPERPGASPPYDQRNVYRNSPSRRSRPVDIETGGYQPVSDISQHQRGRSASSFADSFGVNSHTESMPLSPTTPDGHASRHDGSGQPISRKRSLIRPERKRIDRDHRNYHYHKHAAHMNVLPSSTGNDPIHEDLEASTDRSNSNLNEEGSPRSRRVASGDHEKSAAAASTRTAPTRSKSGKIHKKSSKRSSRQKSKQVEEQLRPPTFWNVYCAIVTFWSPAFIMKCCGMPTRAQQRAWREKMGLISIILCIMAIVGFLTFGFTATVCGAPAERLRVNKVDGGNMIFHGVAYDLSGSHHPAAEGMPLRGDGLGPNVLYDLPEKHGGQDGSFLFQNVNGKCKDLITLAKDSDVPTNDDGDLAWYFPCTTFNQDGSTKPNTTIPYYLGYGCHTTLKSRNDFYLDLSGSADVYFTWDDLKNSSRNLMVYSGNVLDLDLLNWFNTSQVDIPDRFKELRDKDSEINKAVRGRDVTRMFQSSADKKYVQCFEEIIKVGSVDTETVGCIASKVVLYCALVLILSVVGARFLLAIIFQWFLCRKYAPAKTSQSSDRRKRNRQIEDWSEDIYRAPPRLPGDGSTVVTSDRTSKRGSFLPTTSRFSTIGGPERLPNQRRMPTTMASQAASSQLLSPASVYKQGNDSRASFLRSDPYASNSSATEGPGPAGFIHDAVVPQPPSDWMP
ncbi:hypothetical protein FZEAL_10839, partial [Fusarium zealandicum]